jgi:hypothetical protein
MPEEVDDVFPVYFSVETIKKGGGIRENETEILKELYDLLFAPDDVTADDLHHRALSFFFNSAHTRPRGEALTFIGRLFSLSGDPEEALWKCAKNVVSLYGSPHLIPSLLDWVLDYKLQDLESRAAPEICFADWDFSVMLFLRYLLASKDVSDFLFTLLFHPLQLLLSSSSPLQQPQSSIPVASSAPLFSVHHSPSQPHHSSATSSSTSSSSSSSSSSALSPSSPVSVSFSSSHDCEVEVQQRIIPVCEMIIDNMKTHVESAPLPLRQFFLNAVTHSQENDGKFAKLIKRFPHVFFFRHFLCPAILNPAIFGLAEAVTEPMRLLARLLHTFCADPTVVTSESFLSSSINLFIKKAHPVIADFFRLLTSRDRIEEAMRGTAVRFAVSAVDRDVVDGFLDFLIMSLPPDLLSVLLSSSSSSSSSKSSAVNGKDSAASHVADVHFDVSQSPEGRKSMSKVESDKQIDKQLVRDISLKRLKRPRSLSLIEATGVPKVSDFISPRPLLDDFAKSPQGSRSRSRTSSPPPLRKIPVESEEVNKEEESKEEGKQEAAPSDGKGDVKEYKFFFATKIKPLRDIFPSHPPPALSWPKDTHTPSNWITVLPPSSSSSLYGYEWGSSETLISAESEFDIIEVEQLTTWFFRDHLREEKHFNYIAIDEAVGPIVCSIEDPTKIQEDKVKVLFSPFDVHDEANCFLSE